MVMNRTVTRFAFDHGLVFVLLALCGYLSWATFAEQSANGAAAGRQVATAIVEQNGPAAKVLIVAGKSRDDLAFTDAAAGQLGRAVVGVVKGQPQDLRAEVETLAK